MLLLRDCADSAKPWICSSTTLPCMPGWLGASLVGPCCLTLLLKSICLDQAESFSFHDMLLVIYQGWSFSTAVPKPQNLCQKTAPLPVEDFSAVTD